MSRRIVAPAPAPAESVEITPSPSEPQRTRGAGALRAAFTLTLIVGIGLGWVGAQYTSLGHKTRPTAERQQVKQAIFRVKTNRKVVALSFDDGPDPRWTPTVLDLLRKYHAKATFFLLGEHAVAYKALVAEEMKAGNSIGNHTYDHPDLELLTPDRVDAEIERGAAAIVDAGGPKTHLFRPPRGLTDEVVGVLADADRYKTIFWELALEHFVDRQPVDQGVAAMLDKVRPGDIILAHDGGRVDRSRTMQALPLLLQGLKTRGFRMVDVPSLLKLGRAINTR